VQATADERIRIVVADDHPPVVRAAQPLRVLVVEDDETTRDALVQFLSDEGFSVESALDGQEALGLAAGGGLDIIVLDLGLPLLDGAAFADIWRKSPRRSRNGPAVWTIGGSPTNRS